MLDKNFKISSFLPPALIRTNGKTIVVPGWHEVPEGTTLEEVEKHWTRESPKTEKKPTHIISEMVDSSKGNGSQYEVKFDGLFWSCTCPGYGFRNNCRHLKNIKLKYNIK